MTVDATFHAKRGNFVLDVDLSLPGTGVTALFGPSGCGKTSLLRAMAGLDHHAGGALKVGDTVWQAEEFFVPTHRRAIGFVFQDANLFPHLSVRHNIEYGVIRVPEEERNVSQTQAIELLDIEALLDRKPQSLSGGELQRVAIARALAVSPQLLLMDEPLASLDANRKREILPYLDGLHRELDIPVIYVSHQANEVARLADHLVLLDAGRALAAGPIHQTLTRLDLPLAHSDDAAAVIDAVVAEQDEAYHLTHLDSKAGRFTVIQRALAVGSRVRLRIAARDVSLTLEPQSETSILNIFPATVTELTPEGESQVIVLLSVGGSPMLARVTRKSAALLQLQPGKAVFAQAKSVALLS